MDFIIFFGGVSIVVLFFIIKNSNGEDNTNTKIDSKSKEIYSDPFRGLELDNYEKQVVFHDNETKQREKRERRFRLLMFMKELEEGKEQDEIVLRQNIWKTNWIDFKQVLLANDIDVLYHFTDRANLESIAINGGLYSWKSCEKKGIKIAKAGGVGFGRDLDSKYGLEDYVRLSFTKEHPMMYSAINDGRIQDPVILEIDLEVVYWVHTIFSDTNATKSGHLMGEALENFQNIRFDILKEKKYFDIADDLKKYYQAEVLVKKHIPLTCIRNLEIFGFDSTCTDDESVLSDEDIPF